MITAPRPPRSPNPPASPETDRRAFVGRAWVFGIVIALLFFGLAARLWFLQIVHGDSWRVAALRNQARSIRSRPPRGLIVDRHGVALAANRSRFAVYATPDVAKSPDVLAHLAALLETTPEAIRATIKHTPHTTLDPLRVALDVTPATVAKIEENRPYLPGVTTAPEPVRWYPNGTLAAHLLGQMGRINPDQYKALSSVGYFSDDFLGQAGLEKSYEKYLHGTPGGTDVQSDSQGRRLRTFATRESIPGGTITLALDAKVQAAAEQVLRENHFTGAAVAINPQTGGILAMASAPTYDPGIFATGVSGKDYAPLNASSAKPLLDRPLDAMYAPGSTFKPIVAAAGLEAGAFTTGMTVNCQGGIHYGRQHFGCWQTHGYTDFYRALAISCDVWFYAAGQKLGPARMASYAKSFGLGEKTGIDLNETKIGTIPSPEWKRTTTRLGKHPDRRWYPGDTLHMSIGQGDVRLTPLQMARAVAALANGGDVLKLFAVEKVASGATGKIILRHTKTVVRHVPISAYNLEQARRGMRVCVLQGTGKVVDLPGIAVAAKTGSAQTDGHEKTHGWFICFAPYDHPTIAIAGVVEYGGHGADTAGRVARAMLQAYFHQPLTAPGSAKSD